MAKKGYVSNLEKETFANENFRKVLYTAEHCQLVLMSLKPGEEIGQEVHHLDQFIRVDKGVGKAVLNGEETALEDGFAVVVPAGVEHNIVNTSEAEPMKLYTVYAPAEHKDGTIHATKADAQAAEEHFDGQTTES